MVAARVGFRPGGVGQDVEDFSVPAVVAAAENFGADGGIGAAVADVVLPRVGEVGAVGAIEVPVAVSAAAVDENTRVIASYESLILSFAKHIVRSEILFFWPQVFFFFLFDK